MKKLLLILVSLFLWPVIGLSLTAEQVYKKVSNSVFILVSFDFATHQMKARGSAVAVGKNIVVTNCHVALSGDYLLIKLHNDDSEKEKSQVARLFYKNEKQDLCFLEIPGARFSSVKIRPSANVKIGEEVFAVGNPKGTERTISQGIVSNKHEVDGGIWLQTDARIYFGSSGGGLFDAEGNLVGITTKMGGNFGFALPTEWIAQVMTPEGMRKHQLAAKDLNKPMMADDDQVSPQATTSLSHLGDYGKDKIGLYRNNSECFLLIPGKDTNGNVMSAVMWNPKYETTLIVFPSVAAAEKAISIVYQAVLEKKTKNQETYRSDSVLYVADHPYPLYGSKTEEKKYPFLVLVFADSPRDVLLTAGSFRVVYKDTDPQIGNQTITYPLLGIAEALSAYSAKCM